MHATRMIIGEAGAVSDLWAAARPVMPGPREDRPGQPVYAIEQSPDGGSSGLRAATIEDLDLLLPACAATHREELGVDPLERDPDAFRLRTVSQIRDGRSWLWVEDGTILFKAEASAWTPSAVQLQQVWVDPEARRAGPRDARDQRSLPAAPRADADGVPLRPPRERRRDPPVREDRDAPGRHLPQRALLSRGLFD